MAEELEERIYTIPLRREWLKQTRSQRTGRAVRTIQASLLRHMKASSVKISPRLNEKLWEHGVHKPPAKIKLKAKRDKEGVVTARLPEEIEVEKKEEKKGRLDALKEKAGMKAEPKFVPKKKEAPKEEKPEEKKEEAKKEEKAPEKAKEEKEEKK